MRSQELALYVEESYHVRYISSTNERNLRDMPRRGRDRLISQQEERLANNT